MLIVFLSFSIIGCSTMNRDLDRESSELKYLKIYEMMTNSKRKRVDAPQWQMRNEGEIAPGYKIRLYEPSDPSLAGVFQVNEKGKLRLPYEVELFVEGLQQEELITVLNKRFRKFLRRPNFDATIEEKEVFVNLKGLVEKPGTYLIPKDTSLDEILMNAGGLQNATDPKSRARYVRITQLGAPRLVNLQDYFSGEPGIMPIWQGGETLFFLSEGSDTIAAERDYIHVLGEVLSPGAYPFSSRMDVLSYLTDAGGPTDRADLSRMTLLSRNQDGLMQSRIDFDDVSSLPTIQPGDTLIVHSSNPTELERGSGVAASLAAVLSSIGLIAIGL